MIKKFIIAILICGVLWEVLQQLNHIPISINSTLNERKLTHITTDKHYSTNAQKEKFSSSNAALNAQEFIISTTITANVKKHSAVNDIQNNTHESKQKSQFENESN